MPHDARALNHMDPETRAIHCMLESWGRWANEGGGAWPAQTLLSRLIEYGPQGAANGSTPPVTMPQDIAAVDGAVARLGAIDREALKAYYTKWEPIEAIARRTGMRARQLQRVLWRARWRLKGLLDA